MLRFTIKLIISLSIFISTFTFAERRIDNQTCGIERGKQLTAGNFGPYDYTNPQHQHFRPTVEDYHFTREVELLKAAIGGATPGSDIQYTLRKFPNHHRALYSMVRYQTEQHKWLPLDFSKLYSMNCFFERAHYFKPNDPMVYMLQAIYYYKIKQLSRSEQFYLKSLSIFPDNAEANYNIALLYIELNNLEAAKKYAQAAYKLGHPLQGLKNKLAKLNITVE